MRLLVCFLWIAAAASAWAQNTPILIDTDAGSDDFMAVALLLAERVPIDAITVSNGMAHVEAGARNMGKLLDLAGRAQIPVFAGRSQPLRGTAEFPSEWRRISDELPGVKLPAAARSLEVEKAATYLVRRLRRGPPARILALGPLTNLAEALQHDRSISANIQEIVIMGGAIRVPGNLQDGGALHTDNKTAEWNMFIDPLAASIVFRSGVSIRLVALDATNKVPIGSRFLGELLAKAQSPLGHAVAQILAADREMIDAGIFYAWDPLAAAALLQPNLLKTVPVHIEVRQDPPEAGRTVATPAQPNARVAVDADASAFRSSFLAAFGH